MPLRLILKWLSLRWRLANARRNYDQAEREFRAVQTMYAYAIFSTADTLDQVRHRMNRNKLTVTYYAELAEIIKKEMRDTCHLIQRSGSLSFLRRLRF